MVSIIIPAHNEQQTLQKIVLKVLATKIHKEIVIVNDGSTDSTKLIAEKLAMNHREIKVVNLDANYGKGRAICEGLNHIKGNIVLIQDADLEYDPKDYQRLLKPFDDLKVNVVYGSREKVARRGIYSSIFYYLGGELLTYITNLLYGTKITDEATGYKVFRRTVLSKISLQSKGFEFCPEVTAKVARLGYPIFEVPISYSPRSFKEGKKIRAIDGLIAIWTLLKYRFLANTNKSNMTTGLEITQETRFYNQWLMNNVCKFVSGLILEPAAGLGTIADMLYEKGFRKLVLSDFDKKYVNLLKKKYKNVSNIKVYCADLNRLSDIIKLPKVDTVVSINTFEHIKYDQKAIAGLAGRLKRGGRMVIFVPAIKMLYGEWDKSIFHFRRYSYKELKNKVVNSGMKVVYWKYMNFPGIFAWGISKLLKRTPNNINPKNVYWYDKLILSWWTKIEDKIKIPIGQSILMVGEKT